MIERLLPPEVVTVEIRGDCSEVALSASEREYVERAVEKRRREFTTGRVCARRAQELLGLAPVPIPVGPHGEPRWPRELVGSITHCTGYRACALARAAEVAAIGVDAEPHAPLPSGVLEEIASGEERERVAALARRRPAIHWDRLLFCAKEAAYKALFATVQRVLGFDAAEITIDERSATFRATIAPGLGALDTALAGQWTVSDGLVLTAIAVSNLDRPHGDRRA